MHESKEKVTQMAENYQNISTVLSTKSCFFFCFFFAWRFTQMK